MGADFVSEVHIEAPPEAFFAAFREVSAWPGWLHGGVQVQRLTPGDFGTGTRWRETRRMFRRDASEEFEVTAWDPPRLVALFVDGSKGSTGKGEFRFRYEVEPRGNGANVRLHGEIAMPGWYSRVMARLFLGAFRKSCERDLRVLKAHLEAQHGTGAGG